MHIKYEKISYFLSLVSILLCFLSMSLYLNIWEAIIITFSVFIIVPILYFIVIYYKNTKYKR